MAKKADSKATPREPKPFPVVGIGASAGGLEALQQFFGQMPADSGMAFIVVLHMSPDQKSLLAELLAKETRMEVLRVENRMRIRPDKVYVITPSFDLMVQNGRLRLEKPELAHGHRQPIDRFLRTLAEDQGENVISVILSGTGSDGSLGVRAVKAAGGLVVVQEEVSARYPGMPHSAIETGVADLILPVEKIPAKLIEFVHHSAQIRQPEEPRENQEEILLRLPEIFKLIRGQTGHDFSSYKTSTVVRRIARRMAVNGQGEVGGYVELLQAEPNERRALFKDLLISVTNFFRDPEAFEALRREAVAPLVEKRDSSQPLKVWVAGCATGEEAYSVAILFREEMIARQRNDLKVQIFATDLDEAAIESARLGRFPDNIAADVSTERLERFFRKAGDIYQISNQIREMVIFSHHNLTRDPPFSRLDLVCCRNLLIYLDAPIQKKILPLFHYAIKPAGYLFLGTSESIGGFSDIFATVDKKWKIFQRKETARPVAVDFPLRAAGGPGPAEGGEAGTKPPGEGLNLGQLAERGILLRYAPPAVLINEKMEVVYFSSSAFRYLEPPVGEPSMNILKLSREELRPVLRGTIRKAFSQHEPCTAAGVKLKLNGRKETINLLVEPLREPAAARGLALVFFEPAPAAEGPKKGVEAPAAAAPGGAEEIVRQLEEELRITSEQLQSTIEELETSNEELKSSNEELMSMNEELQSSNEEIESSKEELQALNEELTTVNAELERKMEELTDVNSDLQNLLNSSQIATVFLDKKLRVRRFTPAAMEIFHLIESDVGRPFHHISGKIENPQVESDTEKVLKTLEACEREVRTSDDLWFILRILPYRTVEDVIDGVVITLTDITERKKAGRSQALLAAIVDSSGDAIIGTDPAGVVTSWNPGAEELFGYSAAEAKGRSAALLFPPDRKDDAEKIMEKLKAGLPISEEETVCLRKNGRRIQVCLSVSPIRNDDPDLSSSIIARDITLRLQAREALQLAKEAAEDADRAKTEFLANVSHELRTPLTITLSALEQVLESELGDLQRKYLTMAYHSSESLLKLMEGILDLSKIEARHLTLVREPFDLRQCVEGAVDSFSLIAERKGLTLRHEVAPEIPQIVVGDGDRLKQVLLNLISNAIKFTEKGEVVVTVGFSEVVAAGGESPLLFTVRDTGIGIPSEKLNLLFRRFSQVDSSSTRRFGGAGLGLAICRGLVEAMGGGIHAESEEGQGSLFTFLLPLVRADQRVYLGEVNRRDQKGRKPRKAVPGRILLAEDEPQLRDLLADMLRRQRWEVVTAASGAEALQSWEDGVDLILLDIQMPGMNGFQVARAVREKEKLTGRHVPIIALTALASWGGREASRQAGMDDYLIKPVAAEELFEVVARHLPKMKQGEK